MQPVPRAHGRRAGEAGVGVGREVGVAPGGRVTEDELVAVAAWPPLVLTPQPRVITRARPGSGKRSAANAAGSPRAGSGWPGRGRPRAPWPGSCEVVGRQAVRGPARRR